MEAYSHRMKWINYQRARKSVPDEFERRIDQCEAFLTQIVIGHKELAESSPATGLPTIRDIDCMHDQSLPPRLPMVFGAKRFSKDWAGVFDFTAPSV